jgi:hypothetical protein
MIVAFEQGKEVWKTIHRRGGKDLFDLKEILLPEAFEKPGSYQYIWPSLKQGRDSFWEGKDEEGRDIMQYYIPQEMILHKDNADMKLTVASVGGTSLIQVFGTNDGQYIALRGKPSNGAVFSEAAFQDPRADEIISPMIRKTNGWRTYNSTPNGNNWYKQRWDLALKNQNCFCLLATVNDTYDHNGNRLITDADIEKERADGKSEDFIQQEYYCSFNQGIEGTYVGRQIQQARNDGRILRVPYDPSYLVDTFWDIGIGDKDAIWFVQRVGKEIRIIDYREQTGATWAYWARVFKDTEYLFGRHYAPFDIKNREKAGKEEAAKTRLEWAKEVGIKFLITPDASFENGCDAIRGILNLCCFDEVKTAVGVKHLEQWGRVWNKQEQRYTDFEKRDEHTHAGAAARYMAINIRKEQGYNVSKSSEEKRFKGTYRRDSGGSAMSV